MRVLLADDEAIIRMDLAQMLREMGAVEVRECRRGDEAVKLAGQHKWDLIILDIVMPGMDGLEAAKIINKKMLGPVILLTAYDDAETVARAEESGVLAYLVKPVEPGRLKASVHLAMARFNELKKLRSDLRVLRSEKAGMENIEQAKRLLQSQWKMSEGQAYSFIRQQSMSRQEKMSTIAGEILTGRLDPNDLPKLNNNT